MAKLQRSAAKTHPMEIEIEEMEEKESEQLDAVHRYQSERLSA